MAKRHLLLDIGNSRIKWCYALDGGLQPGSLDAGSLDEFAEHCQRAPEGVPDRILLSSVSAHALVEAVAACCQQRFEQEPERLHSRAEQGGVTSGYANPENLGVDRWLAIVGAVARYGKPVIIWDLGTASTLDAVDQYGKHIGGWILPGPETMLESLAQQTQLEVPERLEATEHDGVIPPGRDTGEAIRRGTYAAQKGALNQFMKNFDPAGGEQPRIVVTGGAALPMLEYLEHACIVDPLLVFRGMLVD